MSLASIALVAVVDWRVEPNVSLGLLYLVPLMAVALYSPRWLIVTMAIACSILREVLSPLPWSDDAAYRIAIVTIAFAAVGLFVAELARNRQLVFEHATELGEQVRRRQEAEAELRVLIDSSPAAILTLDSGGCVLLANEAAHELLGAEPGRLRGVSIDRHLPALASLPERRSPLLRTTIECMGRRADGELFLAHVWFSTYDTDSGHRLAAIVLDASEQLRERETTSLHSVAQASRVLFGAVSHEVRNLSAAAAVAHANLARMASLAQSADFLALGALVDGLNKLASTELRLSADAHVGTVDLHTVVDELRVVVDASFREADMQLDMCVPDGLPAVRGEHHSLLQIFLNLAQNSHRVMANCAERRLVVEARSEGDHVVVRFRDTGPGVAHPEELFRPLTRRGSAGNGLESTGLGLLVSRTIARSFAGDLRYERQAQGSCFAVDLVTA